MVKIKVHSRSHDQYERQTSTAPSRVHVSTDSEAHPFQRA
ncbi:hypothetical protein KIPB_015384, partial [Kipferlia bialata]|eukprot:g15384.t1